MKIFLKIYALCKSNYGQTEKIIECTMGLNSTQNFSKKKEKKFTKKA